MEHDVRAFFAEREITLRTAWLQSAIGFIKYHNAGLTIPSLCKAVLEQFLFSDLVDSYEPPMKVPIAATKLFISKKMVFQILDVVDISQPIYNQVRALRHTGEDLSWFHGDHDEEEATTSKVDVSVEHQSRRNLRKVRLSDGTNTFCAINFGGEFPFDDDILPGSKIILTSRVLCRKGIMLLSTSNCELLGGNVRTMCEKWNRIEWLSSLLNAPDEKRCSNLRMKVYGVSGTVSSKSGNVTSSSTISPFLIRTARKKNDDPKIAPFDGDDTMRTVASFVPVKSHLSIRPGTAGNKLLDKCGDLNRELMQLSADDSMAIDDEVMCDSFQHSVEPITSYAFQSAFANIVPVKRHLPMLPCSTGESLMDNVGDLNHNVMQLSADDSMPINHEFTRDSFQQPIEPPASPILRSIRNRIDTDKDVERHESGSSMLNYVMTSAVNSPDSQNLELSKEKPNSLANMNRYILPESSSDSRGEVMAYKSFPQHDETVASHALKPTLCRLGVSDDSSRGGTNVLLNYAVNHAVMPPDSSTLLPNDKDSPWANIPDFREEKTDYASNVIAVLERFMLLAPLSLQTCIMRRRFWMLPKTVSIVLSKMVILGDLRTFDNRWQLDVLVWDSTVASLRCAVDSVLLDKFLGFSVESCFKLSVTKNRLELMRRKEKALVMKACFERLDLLATIEFSSDSTKPPVLMDIMTLGEVLKIV